MKAMENNFNLFIENFNNKFKFIEDELLEINKKINKIFIKLDEREQ